MILHPGLVRSSTEQSTLGISRLGSVTTCGWSGGCRGSYLRYSRFAIVNTACTMIAIPIEERDLAAALSEPYVRYKEEMPMIPPIGER